MLGITHNVFKDSAFDCFLDLMPALHNYVTIDTEAFLSDENHMVYIFDMCKTVGIQFLILFNKSVHQHHVIYCKR